MKKLTIKTYADGFGKWRAEVTFPHTLSESDDRKEFNLGHQLPGIRRKARDEIVYQIACREQTTRESFMTAAKRVRASLPPLAVVAQNIDAQNRWHGITLGE